MLAGMLILNSFNTIGYAASTIVARSRRVRDNGHYTGSITIEASGNTIRAVGKYKMPGDSYWSTLSTDYVTIRSGYDYRAKWDKYSEWFGSFDNGYWHDVFRVILIEYKKLNSPSSITVPNNIEGDKSFIVSWGVSPGATRYDLERSINGGGFSQVYSGTGRTFTDTAQSNWNTVVYRVRAYDGEEFSDYRTSPIRTVIHNTIPTLTIITPSENSYFV